LKNFTGFRRTVRSREDRVVGARNCLRAWAHAFHQRGGYTRWLAILVVALGPWRAGGVIPNAVWGECGARPWESAYLVFRGRFFRTVATLGLPDDNYFGMKSYRGLPTRWPPAILCRVASGMGTGGHNYPTRRLPGTVLITGRVDVARAAALMGDETTRCKQGRNNSRGTQSTCRSTTPF